jgi:hypothetical protein
VSFGSGESDEELRRSGEQDAGASRGERAHERRASLQERQSGGDELLSFELVDATAASGDREG